MTDWIKDQNGDFHLDNGSEFVLDPNSRFHLVNTSDFVNDGSEVLKAKSIYSDNGKIKSDGNGNLTVNAVNVDSNYIGLAGSSMAPGDVVSGQGTQIGWNLSGGDAWTYTTNIVPNNSYDSAGFYWRTVLSGDSITSTTPSMSLTGEGELSVNSINIEKLSISEKTDSSNKSGYVISSTDFNHIDIFGGKLSSTSEFDFSDQNTRSFYTWPNIPTGQFVFGFSSSGLTVDSLTITQDSTTFNNNVIVTGTTSLDNGKITTDGSGSLTIDKNLNVNNITTLNSDIMMYGNFQIHGTNGFEFGAGTSSVNWLSYVESNSAITVGGNFAVDGITALDNGKITTNGSGNLFCGAIDSTGESHFYSVAFDDPDSGVSRDAKFGDKGIAVRGGIKTDTLVVSNGATGTFTSADGKTITVTSGIITSIS